ncbi:hypothetical protein [Stenotrophomonas rhizophila]|uniref:hypothetical protein n=1 Tax=Stenotrophomonas rhizophila TaxID=216778 RepID=UPI001E28F8B1|nr:hypothetical protein [Stenotrophomonas rhizophila]MCC7634620.1 hypothetical protein [Stenotrophomonas rhizophila]MCC7664111.1 hypothetical protein [Stenotrophomonas rhizophila]
MRELFLPAALLGALLAAGPALAADADHGRQWLAGDHHVHSEWSVDWDRSTTPPTPIRGGDSPYTRSRNAAQAQRFGLRWMVHTDHGGPGHSAVTRDLSYPALLQARADVPGLIQFNGMEFDVPAGEHASLIIAPGPHERDQLVTAERDYSRGEPLEDGSRDSQQHMLAALAHLRTLTPLPLMFINHPARTASAMGQWGEVTPEELRDWHDAAPQVLVGMEGAPGHQATVDERGLYRNAGAPTLGGFDQMTAQAGGAWDALLAQQRRFWISASSDSHVNLRDGGRDFDPGQYSKTYVWARPQADDILDGLRHGRMFAVTGDLIDALELSVQAVDGGASATMGQTLRLPAAAMMRVQLRVRQPATANAAGQRPPLQQLQLLVGSGDGAGGVRMQTRRFTAADWQQQGAWRSVSWELPVPAAGGFVRARGSNTAEAAPLADVRGEDPWQDLWFYSNPVFIQTAR